MAAAKQEGTVVVLAPPGERLRNSVIDAFHAQFPEISVEWSGGPSPDQAVKLEAERRAGVYSTDVFIAGTNVAVTQMKPAGALDPLPPALILPEVTDPANWRDGRLYYADTEGTLDLVFGGTPQMALIYDPRQARADEVDRLDKLLDPKWTGRIVLENPMSGGLPLTRFRFVWHVMGPEKGAAYIRALRAQVGAVDRDRRRLVEWIARGRYAIHFNPQQSMVQQLQQEGMTIGSVVEFKDYGAELSAGPGSLMLLNSRPHPNAGKVFANWLLTRDGQTAFESAVVMASRRVDVPTDYIPPELVPKPGVRYVDSSPEEYAVPPPELMTLLKELFPD
ncbi:MAG TPA: extracellular solute-binding protein [Chloroflexota bacterium]